MAQLISIRAARVGDESIISDHRAGMFRDMGKLTGAAYDEMHAASVAWLERAIPSGEYLGWLAHPMGDPSRIIGGVGVLLRNAPPTMTNAGAVRTGTQALVINVFTDTAWRRQGVARLLMDALLDECHARNVLNVVLHAAPDGRRLYETLGFVPTNEMRLGG